jgi:periplasmic protein TonB
MMWVDRLNDQRHNVSSVVSLLMVGAVWFMTQSILPVQRSLPEEPMELILMTPEPVRPVMPLSVPPPPAQPPKPVLSPSQPTPAMPPPPVLTAPTPAPPTTAAAVTAAPVSQPLPSTPSEPARVESPRPAQPAAIAPPQPVAEPAKPAPPPSSAAVENGYVVNVRALLNANKRYPTGREASLQRPSGKAVVWFVLNRNGTLQEAGIEGSSNSILLDNAAVSTVRRTSYTPWPEGSWPGQTQHRFTVTLDFVPLN